MTKQEIQKYIEEEVPRLFADCFAVLTCAQNNRSANIYKIVAQLIPAAGDPISFYIRFGDGDGDGGVMLWTDESVWQPITREAIYAYAMYEYAWRHVNLPPPQSIIIQNDE